MNIQSEDGDKADSVTPFTCSPSRLHYKRTAEKRLKTHDQAAITDYGVSGYGSFPVLTTVPPVREAQADGGGGEHISAEPRAAQMTEIRERTQ